jgi:hypothetical protein
VLAFISHGSKIQNRGALRCIGTPLWSLDTGTRIGKGLALYRSFFSIYISICGLIAYFFYDPIIIIIISCITHLVSRAEYLCRPCRIEMLMSCRYHCIFKLSIFISFSMDVLGIRRIFAKHLNCNID